MIHRTTSPRTPVESLASAGVLGVLLLRQDDPAAPSGCSALREPDGIPLVLDALRLLAGHVLGLIILTPAPVESGLREVLARGGKVGDVRVMVVTGESIPSWRDLVRTSSTVTASDAEPGWVIVHEPAFAVVPPELFVLLWSRTEVEDCDAVIPVRPVTDTLKQVDRAGRIVATVDRDSHRMLCTPQLYRAGALPGSSVMPEPDASPRAVPEAAMPNGTVRGVVVPEPGTGIGAGTEALVAEVRAGTGRVALIEAPAGLAPVDPLES
jgi:2-C-methyl-D-erythritol 4-phosphate cytidylyltransferase